GGDLRCIAASTCRARGDICSKPEDCCSGACLNGRCPTQSQLGGKLFVGEPCANDSDCASYACAASYPGGPKLCQFLGGCRPADEVCNADFECCSHQELSPTRNSCVTPEPTSGVCAPVAGVPGLKRCKLLSNPKEIGEICRSAGNKVHDCCGGEEVCQPTVTGVSRCMGGVFLADGGFVCRGNGEPCSVPEQCCNRTCVPVVNGDGGTELRCTGCVAAGEGCTTDSDQDMVVSWKCAPADPTLDCADEDARARPGGGFQPSAIIGERKPGTLEFDFDCNGVQQT
ncbi:MAG: hypothetical protein ACK4N5_14275, partial [Myxococcales bacterium]